jgi:hypothetical protein
MKKFPTIADNIEINPVEDGYIIIVKYTRLIKLSAMYLWLQRLNIRFLKKLPSIF